MGERQEQGFYRRGQGPRTRPPNQKPRPSNPVLDHLGVRDLREHLDRKRVERGTNPEEGSLPPPDPSFNYLRDSIRETSDNPPSNSSETSPSRGNSSNKIKPPQNKGERRGFHRGGRRGNGNGPRRHDIDKPLNIKIEFSTSTGEHVYTLDQEDILPPIKHVPDQTSPRFYRGAPRGRGRGRGRGRFPNKANSGNSEDGNNENSIKTCEDAEGSSLADTDKAEHDGGKVENFEEGVEQNVEEILHDYDDENNNEEQQDEIIIDDKKETNGGQHPEIEEKPKELTEQVVSLENKET